jgi:hypothetical protein
MEHEIGQTVSALVFGKVVRIVDGYSDNKLRYFIDGGHCITACVTDNEVKKSCKFCKGTGWVLRPNGDDVDKDPCDCRSMW